MASKQIRIISTPSQTLCISEDYNFKFDKKTGYFARWGKTLKDDPKVGMLEIFDLEVSTVCNGIGKEIAGSSGVCKHCYKSNNPNGKNMSFDTFKEIFDKLPKTLTQIAFGIGNLHVEHEVDGKTVVDLYGNPDLIKMFKYCREKGVIPNLTTSGYMLTDETAKTFAELCGAVAVSIYEPRDVCYNAVKKLTSAHLTNKILVKRKIKKL